jgi:glycosyltransferase involved in cell wall biosynthesis
VTAQVRACGKPLRIGYVVKVYPRYSETFIVNEILAHEDAGLSVDVFSLRPSRDTHFQDAIARVRAPVTYLGDSALKAEMFWSAMRGVQHLPGFQAGLAAAEGAASDEVYAALVLARAISDRGIMHLHAHFATSPTSVARMAAAMAGVTYSFTAHAKDIFHESVNAAELERKLADAAAAVTVSDFNLAHLTSAHNGATRRLRRIYNGLDLQRFAFHPPHTRAPLVLAVGRLVEKKGFSTLVDACARLARRGLAFTCELIGGGELEGALRAQIARLGLERQVVLTGPKPQSAVMQAMARASVLALPCVVGADGNRDGLPTVLLEAMALGTPCVATDVTGIPEVVEHGRTGVIVAQHDASELAMAIERLIGDASLRVRLAEAARHRIEMQFDVRRTASDLRAMFAACTEAGPRVAAEV